MVTSKKYFILFTTIALLCFHPYRGTCQVGYGPEIGIGGSGIKFAPNLLYSKASENYIWSGEISYLADIPMSNNIFLQTGISISRKGGKRNFSYYQSDSLNEAIQQSLTIGYGNLPLEIIFKSGKQGDKRLFFGVGATASYIILGNNKIHASGVYYNAAYNTTTKSPITPNNPLIAFDIGISLKAGIELPTGLYFCAYYVAGMNNLGLGTEIDKNRMLGVGIGFFRGRGRNINDEKDDLIDKSSD